MPLDQPFISCLCATYRRPRLLENAIACFMAQDYPTDSREMVILDDAGQIAAQQGQGWRVISTSRRFDSLPEKMNALAGMAAPPASIFVVMDDDDIYLPWHLTAHAEALARGDFSKPGVVLSLYTGQLRREQATKRFHGSIAFTRALYDQERGWPVTRRADFDQQFIDRLAASGRTIDCCRNHAPSYVFRWGSTAAYHCQGWMKTPDDITWYEEVNRATADAAPVDWLKPQFDLETMQVLEQSRDRTMASESR
jgi:hypothetical protein